MHRFRQVRTIYCQNILYGRPGAAVFSSRRLWRNAPEHRGRIRGTVIDSSVAAIAAAKVSIIMRRRAPREKRKPAMAGNTFSLRFQWEPTKSTLIAGFKKYVRKNALI